MTRVRLTVLMFICTVCATTLVAQRRAPGVPVETKVPVTIALQVGGAAYKVTGQGTCNHAAQAAIYGVLSEQWSVQQSEGSRSVSLTMWRPKNGSGDMLSLAVSGAKSHTVNTVKAPNSGPTQGSGTVTFAPAGKGGTFTIDATTAEGTTISGTIQCEAFTVPRPVAGN